MKDNQENSPKVILAMLGLTLLVGVGCSVPEAAVYADRGDDTAGEASAESQILAEVGDLVVTEAEVEELMSSQLLKIDQQRYDVMKQGLEKLVADRLIEQEAAKRGVSVDELIEQEVTSKVAEPTGAEIDAFYEERKARIRQPKEEVSGQIRDYLMGQRRSQATDTWVAGLKSTYGSRLLLEPVRIPVEAAGFPYKGATDPVVTIVEFSDFECPYCARVNPTLEQVMKKYGDKVRLVFRQFPLNIHPNAQKAAEASLCAAEQGKFWQMHDAMFKEQRSLGVEQLKEKAARLDLDATSFNECLDSSRHSEAVLADLQAGSAVGVTGTPAFFINGRFLSGAQPYAELAKVIDEELAMNRGDS